MKNLKWKMENIAFCLLPPAPAASLIRVLISGKTLE
jgi:hypothetical protein